MKHLVLILTILALAGCQSATSAADTGSAPSIPLTRTAQKLADGTCGSRAIHDSLVATYAPYGSYCRVPDALRTPHKDGSLPDSVHGAGVAYTTWTTNDGDCNPRAWAIDNVKHVSACWKHPENFRWMWDTAYKMPTGELTYGMGNSADLY